MGRGLLAVWSRLLGPPEGPIEGQVRGPEAYGRVFTGERLGQYVHSRRCELPQPAGDDRDPFGSKVGDRTSERWICHPPHDGSLGAARLGTRFTI